MASKSQWGLSLSNEPTVEEKLSSVASPSRSRRQSFESFNEPTAEGKRSSVASSSSSRRQSFESLQQEVRMIVGDSESIDQLTRAVRAEARAEKAELELLRIQANLAEKEQRHQDSLKLLDQSRAQNEDLRTDLEISKQRVAELSSRLQESTATSQTADKMLQIRPCDAEGQVQRWKRRCEELEKQLSQRTQAQDSAEDLQKQLSHVEAQLDLWKQRCQELQKMHPSWPAQEKKSELKNLEKRLSQSEAESELWKRRCQEIEEIQPAVKGNALKPHESDLQSQEMIKDLQTKLSQAECQSNHWKLECLQLEQKPGNSRPATNSGCSSARSSSKDSSTQPQHEYTSMLESDLSLARAEVETLRNRLWQAERDLTLGKRQSSSNLAELQKLRVQCNEAQEEVVSCKSHWEKAEASLSRKNEELQEIRAKTVPDASIAHTAETNLLEQIRARSVAELRVELQEAKREAAAAAQANQLEEINATNAAHWNVELREAKHQGIEANQLEEICARNVAQLKVELREAKHEAAQANQLEEISAKGIVDLRVELGEAKQKEAKQMKQLNALHRELVQQEGDMAILREHSSTLEEQLESAKCLHVRRRNFDHGSQHSEALLVEQLRSEITSLRQVENSDNSQTDCAGAQVDFVSLQRAELEHLQSECKEQADCVGLQRGELEHLQSECKEQGRLFCEISSHLKECEKQNACLSRELQEVEDIAAQQQAQLNDDLQRAEAECVALRSDCQEMEYEHLKRGQSYRDHCGECAQRLDECQEMRYELRERGQSYREQKRELIAQVEQQRDKCTALTSKLQEAKAECRMEQKEMEHHRDECMALSLKLDETWAGRTYEDPDHDDQERTRLASEVQTLREKIQEVEEAEEARAAVFVTELEQARSEDRKHCNLSVALRAELRPLKREQTAQVQSWTGTEQQIAFADEDDVVRYDAAEQGREVAAMRKEIEALQQERDGEAKARKQECAAMHKELRALQRKRCTRTSVGAESPDTHYVLLGRRAELAEEQASEAAVQCVAGKLEALQHAASEAQARRAQGQVMLAGARHELKSLHSALQNQEAIATHQRQELMQISAEGRYWYENSEHFKALVESRHSTVPERLQASAPLAPFICTPAAHGLTLPHSTPATQIFALPRTPPGGISPVMYQRPCILEPNHPVGMGLDSASTNGFNTPCNSCSFDNIIGQLRENSQSTNQGDAMIQSSLSVSSSIKSSSRGSSSSRSGDPQAAEQTLESGHDPGIVLESPSAEPASKPASGSFGRFSEWSPQFGQSDGCLSTVEARVERWKGLCAEHESATQSMSMDYMQARVECSHIRAELREALELRGSTETAEVLGAETEVAETRLLEVEAMLELQTAQLQIARLKNSDKSATCPFEEARLHIEQTERQFTEAKSLLEGRITTLAASLRAAEEEGVQKSCKLREEAERRVRLQAQKDELLQALHDSEASCAAWRSESQQEKTQLSRAHFELVDSEAEIVHALECENREAKKVDALECEVAQLTLEEERTRAGLAHSQDSFSISQKRNDVWRQNMESRLQEALASADQWHECCERGDWQLRSEIQSLSEATQAEAKLRGQLADVQGQLANLQGWAREEQRRAEQERQASHKEAKALHLLKTEESAVCRSALAQRSELTYAQGETEVLARECSGWRTRLEAATEQAKCEHENSNFELQQASNDCMRWQDEASVLQRGLEEQQAKLKRQLAEQRAEVQQARGRIAQVQQCCDEWQAKAEDYQDEICRVEAEAERHKGLAQSAKREQHQNEQRLNHLVSLHKHAEEATAKWQSASEDKSIEVAQLQAQVTLSGEEIQRLQSQAKRLHAELSTAEFSAIEKTSIVDSESQSDVLRKLGDAQRSLDTYQKEIVWLENSEAEIKAKASSWEQAAIRTTKQLGEQTEELEKLRSLQSSRTISTRDRSPSPFERRAIAAMRSLESSPAKFSEGGIDGDAETKINIAKTEASAKAAEVDILKTELRDCQGREEELTRALQVEQDEASALRCRLQDMSNDSQRDRTATDDSPLATAGSSSRQRSSSQARGEVALAERLAEFHSRMGQSPPGSGGHSQSPCGITRLNLSTTSPFTQSRNSIGSLAELAKRQTSPGALQTSTSSGSPPRRRRAQGCPPTSGNGSWCDWQNSNATLSPSPTPGSQRRFNRQGLMEKGSALVGLEALTAKAAAALEACRTSSGARSPSKC